MVNKTLIGLGIVAPLQLLYTPFSVLLAMVQILLPLTTVTLFGAMLRIDRTAHGRGENPRRERIAGVPHRVLSR